MCVCGWVGGCVTYLHEHALELLTELVLKGCAEDKLEDEEVRSAGFSAEAETSSLG